MLRLRQVASREVRPQSLRTLTAVARSGVSPLRPVSLQRDGPGVSWPARVLLHVDEMRNHTRLSSTQTLAASSSRYVPAACFTGLASSRGLSTSAAGSAKSAPETVPAGASGGKHTATGASAPEGGVGAPPDPSDGADAALAAAGAADQAAAGSEPAAATLSFYSPVDLAVMAIDNVHVSTGMPYWMTIVAITFALRTLIAPVGVAAARNAARTTKMQPEMDQLQAAIEADQHSSQMRRAQRWRQETRALYQKHECSMMMSLALPLVQLPLFISFFMALRKMPDIVPDFATGGTLWFENLGAADPYMIFPLTAGATTLLLTELGADGMTFTSNSTLLRAGMRTMSLVIIPLTANIPVGVFMYWTTSNLYSLAQTLILKAPGVKKRLNFPDPPKKQPETGPEKAVTWADVLGGDHPFKVYRRMKEQQADTWFMDKGGAPILREGAPLPPPPPLTMAGGSKARPTVARGSASKAREPPVVTYASRPKPAVVNAPANKAGDGSRKRGKKRASS